MPATAKRFRVVFVMLGKPPVEVRVTEHQTALSLAQSRVRGHIKSSHVRLDGKRITRRTLLYPRALLVAVAPEMMCTCIGCCMQTLQAQGYSQIMFTYRDVPEPKQPERRPFVAIDKRGRLVSGLLRPGGEIDPRRLDVIRHLNP